MDISEGWKIHKGDNPAWSELDTDDSDWQAIQVGKSWESQGLEAYDGYAWYRKHIKISDSQAAGFRRGKVLKLSLGKIDDVDQTWFNGNRIGETGSMPNAYRPAWSVRREYMVPGDLINWAGDNVIAIRVYDGANDGGMVEGRYQLKVATAADFIKLDFNVGKGDGIFVEDGGLPLSVILLNESKEAVSGDLDWAVENDEFKKLFERKDHVEVAAGQKLAVRCKQSPKSPGFYRVNVTVRSPEGDRKTRSMVLGYQPEKIRSPLTAEPDFDAFWISTLDQLASVEPAFKVTRQEGRDSETHELYLVEMRSLKDVRVRGWYQKPKAAGKHPAMLRVPGYTQSMQPMKLTDPIAVFS
ncbi:MAG: acetylxylan esterase, partial [Planctomycetota bacterium]